MKRPFKQRVRAVLPLTWLLLLFLGASISLGSDGGLGLPPRVTETHPEGLLPSAAGLPENFRLWRLNASIRAWLDVNAEAVQLYARWVIGAPVLIVAIVLGMLLRPRRRKTSVAAPGAAGPRAPARLADAAIRPLSRSKTPKASGKLSEQVQVLRFFLQLFKSQQNADSDAPAQIVRVERRTTCPDETYEIRILHNGEWVSRRMSIGLLGQGGGSRSRCFYVIFDTHMVIKIPAAPLVRFSDYKRQIAAEARIVERLAPRLCIVPKVSVILKAVHCFAESEHLSEDRLEAQYARLLETNPEFQEYLKIDDSFAFFMDLAKHFFLSTTLEEIHSGYGHLIAEARQHPELMWDHHGFVSRYGEEAGSVCHALQEAYYRCEGGLRHLIDQAGVGEKVHAYHLKQWFLSHMAGETIRREDYDLPAEVVTKANQLLSEVVQANRRQVDSYRRHLSEYIRKTRFSQYRCQLENLCSNILDLLVWIGRNKLALRDLKPENLFVAGNPDEYPAFLNDREKFSIGLIDVETAVFFDAEDPVLIAQPQLAGTPLYATPAHLMPNVILLEIYDDLPAILHLQDWFATIAILYRTATGENLFAMTAHVFPEILNRLKILDPAGADIQEEVARIQRLFWNSAVAEFQSGTAKYAAILSLVDVSIPADFAGDIAPALKSEIHELETTIGKAVADQTFFNSGDKRHFLKKASADKIGQMRNKLIQEAESGQSQQGQILLYFELLEKLKIRLEVACRAKATLASPGATLPLDQLLEIMFQKVFNAMYRSGWPELAPKLYGSSAFLTTDINTYQATM
ncbi:MAG: hypothetical protein C4519_04835 [Desulfobacteraceae bacterium]|nr:MAG: hypothetical protein C4519_04835 [Desulfobacteraceae bacterium]